MPPGWPVPQAFSRSSASGPRTSPIGIRSGRSRRDERTRSESEADAVLGAQRHEIGRCALQLARVLDQHHPVAGLGDFGEERVDQRGLAGRGPAGDEDVPALTDGGAKQLGLRAGHDAGLDVVVEREDRDGGPPDREARRRDDGREKALEALSRLGQLGRDARRTGMNLDADMVRDEANDAFGIGRGDAAAGVLKAARQPVDPEPTVGVQHHLDDARIFEIAGDRRPKRGAQHARAAGEGFGPERDCRHVDPATSPRFGADVSARVD